MTVDTVVGVLRTLGVAVLVVLVLLGAVPLVSTLQQLVTVAAHAWRHHYRAAAPYHPRVAVIVPAWNEGAVIRASVERLMTLDYPPERLRVHVVDDASTDDTPAVVAALAAAHPGRVVHLRRERGGEGKAHTLNHGIRHLLADDWTEAALIMDADVVYARDSLRRMTRHLADPQVAAVTAYIAEGSADRPWLTRFVAVEYVLAQLAARRSMNVTGALACLAGGAQLHSRDNLEALGAIDTSTLAEDTVTTLETQLRGRRVVFEPHAVVLAEEPSRLVGLWRQRLRWARGNVQVTARYRHVWFRRRRYGPLGGFAFGVQWFCTLYLPLLMLLVPVGLIGLLVLDASTGERLFRSLWILAACVFVFTMALAVQLDPAVGRTSWREALAFPGLISVAVMVTAFFPGLADAAVPREGPVAGVLTVAVYLWTAVAMLAAWLVRRLEATRLGRARGTAWLVPALIYVIGYGPVLCAITVDAFIKEFRRAEVRWEKTEKVGRVAA